ncbi:Bcr/CflA subfamily drug resistance transporter [Erythrobacter longus]|uniref:Bcr/CflA family efflux transporter n=1 Tax=Erythrobacter longus TaxID=1044 RepID=A0A074MFG6_ERYLO|nr:multidrug effflux MFS transporter [Erythrobacter longus]KEO92204.1 Bcr/CflA subfamily drug resistance transporter [Erythrobacter longus]
MSASIPSHSGPARPEQRPLGQRELIVLMAMLMSLQAFGIDAMLPALGDIARDLSAQGNDRQLVIGIYFLGAGIGALFPGALADRFGRRPILFISLVTYIGFSLACMFVPDFQSLLIMRFTQGLCTAGLSVLPAAVVRDQVGGDKMAKLMSLIMMTFLVVPLIAPAIGQVILMVAGWKAIFGFMAFMGIGVGAWAYFRMPETLAPENAQPIRPGAIARNMAQALSNRSAIGYVIGSSLVFGSLFGFLNSSQQLIAESFGMGDYFAFIFGGCVLGMVLANFLNSRIVERFGARRVSHAALFAFIVSASLQMWSASDGQQTVWEFLPLLSINMAMLGFVGANFSSIAMQPFFHIAGAASSIHTALRMTAGGALGALIGAAYDGTAFPLATAMVVCSIMTLCIVLFSEKGKLFTRPNG